VELKSRLAEAHRNDRERYTEEKGPFIESALRKGSRLSADLSTGR
jgi:GrpB-like predicted nucleotidyltransferase (UPF0157 family)